MWCENALLCCLPTVFWLCFENLQQENCIFELDLQVVKKLRFDFCKIKNCIYLAKKFYTIDSSTVTLSLIFPIAITISNKS